MKFYVARDGTGVLHLFKTKPARHYHYKIWCGRGDEFQIDSALWPELQWIDDALPIEITQFPDSTRKEYQIKPKYDIE